MEAATKQNLHDAHQRAVDNQTGLVAKMTYIRRWIYLYSYAGNSGMYYEIEPIISFKYYESSSPEGKQYMEFLIKWD